MQLMTKAIENALNKQKGGLYAQDGMGFKSKVVVKYFNPCGVGTWYITAGEKQEDGDWLLFGYVQLQFNEWGYVRLSELKNLKVGLMGLGIERDIAIKPLTKTVEQLIRF